MAIHIEHSNIDVGIEIFLRVGGDFQSLTNREGPWQGKEKETAWYNGEESIGGIFDGSGTGWAAIKIFCWNSCMQKYCCVLLGCAAMVVPKDECVI